MSKPFPLWPSSNTTQFSSVFSVSPGEVLVLFATGMERNAARADASQFVTEQAICIRRLIHEFSGGGSVREGCNWIYDLKNVRAETVADELVQTCGLPWQLTMCRNIGILGLPGSYRLELNDNTAVGLVQVYAESYNADKLPPQLKDLFF